jgi:acyl carrier protein
VSTLEQLATLIESVLDADVPADGATRFKDLPGWDSVSAMRLIKHIEKAFAVKLPIKQYLAATTLADVEQLIASVVPA